MNRIEGRDLSGPENMQRPGAEPELGRSLYLGTQAIVVNDAGWKSADEHLKEEERCPGQQSSWKVACPQQLGHVIVILL